MKTVLAGLKSRLEAAGVEFQKSTTGWYAVLDGEVVANSASMADCIALAADALGEST